MRRRQSKPLRLVAGAMIGTSKCDAHGHLCSLDGEAKHCTTYNKEKKVIRNKSCSRLKCQNQVGLVWVPRERRQHHLKSSRWIETVFVKRYDLRQRMITARCTGDSSSSDERLYNDDENVVRGAMSRLLNTKKELEERAKRAEAELKVATQIICLFIINLNAFSFIVQCKHYCLLIMTNVSRKLYHLCKDDNDAIKSS